MSMEATMRQWAAANRKPYDAATWDQMCGSQTFRFNSWFGWATKPRGDISSAYRAAMGSGRLDRDFMRAPVGAYHYFDIAGPGNGHVMQDARGGGLVCLSTGYALSESLGNALGFQSVPGYVAAKAGRAVYLGWATNYSGGTIDVSGLSGGVRTLIEDEPEIPQGSENPMLMIHLSRQKGGANLYAIFGQDFWLEFYGDQAANVFIRQLTPVGSSLEVSQDFWAHCKAAAKPAV